MDQPAKKLTRSTTDSVVAGVCGGIAAYFSVDVTLVRLAFVLMTLWGGSGVPIYSILWIIMPADRSGSTSGVQQIDGVIQSQAGTTTSSSPRQRSLFAIVVGSALMLFGLSSIVQLLFPWYGVQWELVWPAVIIAFGLMIMVKRT